MSANPTMPAAETGMARASPSPHARGERARRASATGPIAATIRSPVSREAAIAIENPANPAAASADPAPTRSCR